MRVGQVVCWRPPFLNVGVGLFPFVYIHDPPSFRDHLQRLLGHQHSCINTYKHQLYASPDLDLLTSACRFTLPGRCAAFGGRNLLAAAGDDGHIKLCRIAPGTGESKVRTLCSVRVNVLCACWCVRVCVGVCVCEEGMSEWDWSDGAPTNNTQHPTQRPRHTEKRTKRTETCFSRSSARSAPAASSAPCPSTQRAPLWPPPSPTAPWGCGTRRRGRRRPARATRPRWTPSRRAAAPWRGRPTAARCWRSRGATATRCCWRGSAGGWRRFHGGECAC